MIPIELYIKETKMTKSKPDYLDFDKDGDKTESMKKALKEKNAKKLLGGGEVKVDEVIRMPQEIQVPGMMGGGMMYKDGGDVQTVTQGHKGMKNTVKYK